MSDTIRLPRRWRGLGPAGSLIVPIPKSKWPPPGEPLSLDDARVFVPKSELHVTVFDSAKGADVSRAIAEGRVEEVAIARAFGRRAWTLTRGIERRVIGRTKRGDDGTERYDEAIVELVDLPSLAAFVDDVAALIDVPLVAPPPHVTLYTRGTKKGIGIPDAAALERWTLARLPIA